MNKKFLSVLLALMIILTLAFIWGNSLMNSEASSKMSNGFLDKIAPVLNAFGITFEDDHVLRKLAHLAEYALLGVEFGLLLWLNGKIKVKDFMLCAIFCLSAASIDESLQLIVGRHGHIHDVLLDLFGGAFGSGAVFAFARCRALFKKRNIKPMSE